MIELKIDELLYNILFKEELLQFAPTFARNTLTRPEHFNQVTDGELIVSFLRCCIFGIYKYLYLVHDYSLCPC